ncbi:unannotated protein [freshwater metagenome]|uniref:Unannotated protein n=1 Tax=freshwater metagenome TaxID=449393 RepID=A0A6J7C439_9ZZZZ
MTPIHISVCAALWLSGFLNAGTPLETASTPDNATAPDEKALSKTIRPMALCSSEKCVASSLTLAGSIGPRWNQNTRTRPTTISVTKEMT